MGSVTGEELVSRLKRAKRSGTGWTARCPAHDDRTPSLSVSEGDDGRLLVKCHAGCATEAVVAALGLALADLAPDTPSRNGATEIVATYDYRDETGQTIFQTVRLAPKGFRQRRPDGAGGWDWKLGNARRVLYRLPELRAAIDAGTAPIYVCEGEKDVEAVRAAGAIATCNPMGAGKWRNEYAEQLRGAGWIIVIADNDDSGRKHAAEVANSLKGAGIDATIALPAKGKDASDHLAAGLGLGELTAPPEDPETEKDTADTWQPRNLALLGERPQTRPTLGGIGLAYPGKRHAFTGPQESAKTLAAYAAVLGVIHEGGAAVLIDLEMGEYDARDRLRDMGATDHDLGRVHYVEPDTEPTTNAIARLIELHPNLVVIDAAAGAYSLTGLDDNKRADVELWAGVWVKPFWRAGIATIVVDHVIKNADGRGKYAIGSERKVGGIDVHLGFEAVLELNRGGRGLYRIVTHKDRPGYLPRPRAAELDVRSDPDTHALTWTFRPADDTGDGADNFRPTALMERVSRHLEITGEPLSRTQLERDVKGKGSYVRQAIDALVRDGHADETTGVRGARLVTLARPYREADE
ncbi:MAG: AAA family ATPase [Thermoleophilia bacterium]|nr:AAA family ATPase [Thermoleophilia bacterium]